ncbi:ferrochelatase [Pedosphaera parvula]|uniref:Ferrochelatase n=1 Tax=Pedosphaera parvula (strain Ellin514) TaxID=320771 RepID=B9XAP5_PEDPL|nr:ferrochelatase [Pedosphaera parvula]EEF63080.1 Ferrochelatase [Pedosphaera parvula Ellin514]
MTKQGVLLINLGSPDSPSVPAVRKYLREFLMDGRVLDTPWPIRFGIVHFAILPKRPKASAHAYKSIWTTAGSPLVVTSKNLKGALQARLSIPVELAMRHQSPSVAEAINELHYQGVDELLVIPLFPHYAMSSYESAVVRVREVTARQSPLMKIVVQPPYYNALDYNNALVASAEDYIKRDFDHLLFSFHGIPERHLRKSDTTGCHCLKVKNCCETPSSAHATCYRAQCFQTMKAFVKQAGIPEGKYSIAFQSRLGRDPWLTPYTDKELERLARGGVKKLLVICPAFVSDCLETLEEIGMRGRETFLHSGGTSDTMIPCLNEHPLWIVALENMTKRFMADNVHQSPEERRNSFQPVAI